MMDPILASWVAVGLLLIFSITFTVIYFRLQRGSPPPPLRPFPAVDSLRALSERSVEEGRKIHLAMGSGRLTDATAAESSMGLIVLNEIAEQARRAGQTPIVTTADPVSQLLASDTLSEGDAERAWETRVYAQFIAPQESIYGAGARGIIQREELGLTAAVGHLGDEYLFLAAEQPDGGQAMYAPEMAATAHVETLPLVHLTARHPLIGEEIFALGAYLNRGPAHLASVILQDMGRLVLLVVILLGALAASLRSLGLL